MVGEVLSGAAEVLHIVTNHNTEKVVSRSGVSTSKPCTLGLISTSQDPSSKDSPAFKITPQTEDQMSKTPMGAFQNEKDLNLYLFKCMCLFVCMCM